MPEIVSLGIIRCSVCGNLMKCCYEDGQYFWLCEDCWHRESEKE